MIIRTTIPVTAPNTSAVIAEIFEVIRSRSTEKWYILFNTTIISYQLSYIEYSVIVQNLHTRIDLNLRWVCLTFYIDDCLWGVFVIVAPLGVALRPTVARRVVVLEFRDDRESRHGSSVPDPLWLEFVVTVPQPSYRGVSPCGQGTPHRHWGVLIHGYNRRVYLGATVREI